MVKREAEDQANGSTTKKPRLVRNEGASTANGAVRKAASRRSTAKTNGSSTATRAGRRGTSTTTRSGRERPIVNEIPDVSQERVNVFVCGAGQLCELGLGGSATNVKRPRLNPLLLAEEKGITTMAVGGAHSLAIDYNGKVWSWGINDLGTLGRGTKLTEEQEDEDLDLNVNEASPGLVEGLPNAAKFIAVGATDNCSAAVTSEGQVWAWGTFIDDSDKAFRPGVMIQPTPTHITSLKGIAKIASGKDHFLLLDKYGDVYSWGIGVSYQLGHPVKSNLRTKTVGPSKVTGLPKIKYVACGEYHSFAIDTDGHLWSWGLNNFGQCAIPEESGDGKCVERPTKCETFGDKKIALVDGGNHHSLILTEDGELYSVGETNFHQIGIPNEKLPKEHTVYERDGTTPAYLSKPTKMEDGADDEERVALPKIKYVACGTDHSIALSAEDGSAWTWGFGEVFQLGHGKPPGEDPEDQPVPARIRNTATTGVNMVWCGAGGQFSVLNGLPKKE